MSVRDRIKMMEQMAMKEREGAPEERGRSPGGVSAKSNASNESPRPLSKVRTSFVAIEKDGRIGLQRQASGDSSFSGRKLSAETEAASSSSILLDNTRTNVSSPDTSRSDLNRGTGGSALSFSPSSIPDPGPASAQPAGRAVSGSPFVAGAPSASASTAASGFADPIRPGSGRQEGLAESPEIRQASRSEAQGGPSSSGARRSGSSQGQASKEREVQAVDVTAPSAKEGSEIARDGGSEKGRPGGSAGRGPAVTEAAFATPLNGAASKAKAIKSTATTTPSSQPKPVGKPHDQSKRSTTPPATAGKPTTDKKTPSTVSPGGFVKPRPKSPTRPLELPARLTTHTAASGQKTKNPPPPAHGNRPASRTSLSSSGKGLGRSSSVANHPRPSFGPPPKPSAKDHPVPKKEAKVDEGFLARMMRPTQASASKMADKVHVPTTPPRKTVTAAKKPASAKSGPSSRVVSASKTTSAPRSAVTTPDTSKKESSASARTSVKKFEQEPIAEEEVALPNSGKHAEAVFRKEPEKVLAQKESAAKEAEKVQIAKEAVTKEAALKEDMPLSDVPSSPVQRMVSENLQVAGQPKLSDNKENVPEIPKTEAETEVIPQAPEQPATTPVKAADAAFAAFMNPAQNSFPVKKETYPAKDGGVSDFINTSAGKMGTSHPNGNHKTGQDEEEEW